MGGLRAAVVESAALGERRALSAVALTGSRPAAQIRFVSEVVRAEGRSGARAPIGRDLAWPLRIVTGALFVVIVALAVAQVGFRYGLGQPLIWSEELAKLLLVWMVFLGAAVLCWDGRHLDVDVVFRLLPPAGRRILRWLNLALAAGFLVALTLWSWDVVVLEGYSDLGALGISRAWLRLPGFLELVHWLRPAT